MAPKDIHTLLPKTCECITLQGRGDCIDEIKVLGLETGRLCRIIEVDLMEGHESLKAENISQL